MPEQTETYATHATTDSLLIDDCSVVPTGDHYCLTAWGSQPALRTRVLRLRGVTLRLQAETTLPKRFGKLIKAGGGHYTDMRGNTHTRYVSLGMDSAELIDALLTAYGPADVQFHSHCDPVIKRVHDLESGLQRFGKQIAKSAKYRLVSEPELADDDARFEREQHNYNCDQVRKALVNVIAQADKIGLGLTAAELVKLGEIGNRADKAKR